MHEVDRRGEGVKSQIGDGGGSKMATLRQEVRMAVWLRGVRPSSLVREGKAAVGQGGGKMAD